MVPRPSGHLQVTLTGRHGATSPYTLFGNNRRGLSPTVLSSYLRADAQDMGCSGQRDTALRRRHTVDHPNFKPIVAD